MSIKKSQYANFYGRASRSELWLFTLFQAITTRLLILLKSVLGVALPGSGMETLIMVIIIATWVTAVGFLIVPSISVAIRRLHDVNLSGWWYLFNFIVSCFLLIVAFIPGTKGKNLYGKDPFSQDGD